MTYFKQLDAVRGVAVLLVIASHWFGALAVVQRLGLGAIGLDTFFVLSGFLITRILLQQKEKMAAGGLQAAAILRSFYIRRALRIFPAYYLTILLLLAIGDKTDTSIRSSFWYFATYTANFYFYARQGWDGMLSHLWSLAVEEQFYLIWPWLMLYVGRHYTLRVILLFIALGVVSQFMLRQYPLYDLLTVTCFDCFGLGALLAWVTLSRPELIPNFYKWLTLAAIGCLLIYGVFIAANTSVAIPRRTCIAVLALWLITYSTQQVGPTRTALGLLLTNPVLQFTGRISYGLYIYHNFIPRLLRSNVVESAIHSHLPARMVSYRPVLLLAESAIVLLITAWGSYQLIELPFLRLKKYADYGSVPVIVPQPAGHR
ncbi:acyltransferase [Fibrella sp. USSR17]